MIVLGIDPGLTGAIAAICGRRGLLDVMDIPVCDNGHASGSMRNWVDVATLVLQLRDWSNRFEFAAHGQVLAAMERPIPMPKLPSQTIASQFDTVGAIRATLICRACAVMMVEPGKWKKRYGLKADKDASQACALRIYPSAAQWLARKKDHNRAEAVLIGDWLLQEHDGARESRALDWAEAA